MVLFFLDQMKGILDYYWSSKYTKFENINNAAFSIIIANMSSRKLLLNVKKPI
jgi:hypothetical protein